MRFHFSPQMDKPLSGFISFYFDDCVACCRELITKPKTLYFHDHKLILHVGLRVRASSQPLEVRVCGFYSILSLVSVWAR